MKDDDRCDRCPRCGSSHLGSDYPKFWCHECGYSWDIDEEEVMRDSP